MDWYHRKLKLQYNPSVFNEIIEHAHRTTWKQGYDQNGLVWNVEELPLSVEDFPILNELYNGLNAEFKRPSFFLSSVKPGGLVNHIDHRKWGNFGIPLLGDFSNSPQYYYDQFNHQVEQFILDTPTIFYTRMLHAVPRKLEDTTPRWVLMMDLFDWTDNLFKKIDNNTIWTNTENFKYD
jgi:hypothetical protein|tara:strand:- start:452 stop:988 length:537 start_codon:yes stop_codon:yes gene_type:complete